MPPTEVAAANVRALVERWFGDERVEIERTTSGGSTPVYRVTVGEAVSYLRLAEEPGQTCAAEVRAHELALAAGIRVPAILRWEADPPELDRSAVLTAAIPGIPLAEFAGDSAAALRAWAREGAALNAIPVRGWGWVTGVSADGGLVAEHATRTDWADEYQRAAARVVAAGVLSPAMGDALGVAITAWCELPDVGVSGLAHGDLDPSHVYVDAETGACTGLIDLGEIRGADALYDLGHALVHAFDERTRAMVAGLIQARGELEAIEPRAIWLQAVAIATRALAIQLGRPPNGYRAALVARLEDLMTVGGSAV